MQTAEPLQLPYILQTPQNIFKITQQILQKTGKSIDQIKNIINNSNIQQYYYNNKNQDSSHLKLSISLMCLSQQKESSIRYNGYGKFTINILNQIAHVQFYNTVSMNLNSNDLLNIEAIQHLNAPKMITLQLYNNRIVNMGSFAKNNSLQNLITLTLYQNKIHQLQKFSRGNLKKLQYMQIQTSSEESPIIHNIWFIIKMQSQIKQQKTKRLWCSSSKRLRPKKFKQQVFNCRFV